MPKKTKKYINPYRDSYSPEAVIGERLLAKNMDAKLNMNFPNFFPYRHYHRDEQQDYLELYEKYKVEESGMWR